MNFIGPIQNSLKVVPSPRYVFFWRGVKDLGSNVNLVDLSGRGNHSVTFGVAGTPGAELTQPTCWDANPGYLTMAARSNQVGDFASLPMATFNLQWTYLDGDSFLIFVRGKFTLPAADAPMLGSGVSNSRPGFKATVRAAPSGVWPAGRVSVAFAPVSGANTYINDTTVAVASAAPTDVSFAIYVDGQARKCSIYVNGVPDRIGEAIPLADYRSVRDLVVGGCINFTNYDGVSCQVSEAQLLTWKAAAPDNPDELVSRLHNMPFHRLSAEECP